MVSERALDLKELVRLVNGGACAVTQRRLREVAAQIISAGLRDFRLGA